jgi:hypothetical protein
MSKAKENEMNEVIDATYYIGERTGRGFFSIGGGRLVAAEGTLQDKLSQGWSVLGVLASTGVNLLSVDGEPIDEPLLTFHLQFNVEQPEQSPLVKRVRDAFLNPDPLYVSGGIVSLRDDRLLDEIQALEDEVERLRVENAALTEKVDDLNSEIENIVSQQ